MKKLKNITITLTLGLLILVQFTGCSKDKNRKAGVCYCEFVKGDDQQYDLTNLSRDKQISQCSTHDQNANKFGGECELE